MIIIINPTLIWWKSLQANAKVRHRHAVQTVRAASRTFSSSLRVSSRRRRRYRPANWPLFRTKRRSRSTTSTWTGRVIFSRTLREMRSLISCSRGSLKIQGPAFGINALGYSRISKITSRTTTRLSVRRTGLGLGSSIRIRISGK